MISYSWLSSAARAAFKRRLSALHVFASAVLGASVVMAPSAQGADTKANRFEQELAVLAAATQHDEPTLVPNEINTNLAELRRADETLSEVTKRVKQSEINAGQDWPRKLHIDQQESNIKSQLVRLAPDVSFEPITIDQALRLNERVKAEIMETDASLIACTEAIRMSAIKNGVPEWDRATVLIIQMHNAIEQMQRVSPSNPESNMKSYACHSYRLREELKQLNEMAVEVVRASAMCKLYIAPVAVVPARNPSDVVPRTAIDDASLVPRPVDGVLFNLDMYLVNTSTSHGLKVTTRSFDSQGVQRGQSSDRVVEVPAGGHTDLGCIKRIGSTTTTTYVVVGAEYK